MRSRRRGVIVGIVVLVGLGAALAAVGLRPFAAPLPAPAPAPPLRFAPTDLQTPQAVALPQVIEFSGPLVAPATAVVRAKAAGTLLALAVAEGDRVGAGQPLGRLDLAELDQRLAEREAALQAARARLAQADRAHATDQRLADQQFISPNALQASRSTLEAARAEAEAAAAQREVVRLGRQQAALVAPIGGWVAKRHALPGEKLAAEQPVLTIVDLSRLELAGSVAPHEALRLRPPVPVALRVEGLGSPLPATLVRIAPAAEPGSRAMGVTVAVDNAGEVLRAGLYGTVRVVVADTALRPTLPTSAIVGEANAAGEAQVWVLEGGVLARRSIVTGRRDEALGRIEVLAGLDPAARVLGARFDNLKEGARAEVDVPIAAAATSASQR